MRTSPTAGGSFLARGSLGIESRFSPGLTDAWLLAVFSTLCAMPAPAYALSWTQTSAPTSNWHAVASSADGRKLVAAAWNGPIITSTNSGFTWVTTGAPITNWFSVASSADGRRLVASAMLGGIFISGDSGATWTVATNAPIPFYISTVASSADGTRLFAGFYDGVHHSGQMAISTNGGADWTNLDLPLISIASSADGSKLFAGFGSTSLGNFSGSFATSTNLASEWTLTPFSATFGWNAVASSANGTKLAAANVDGSGLIFTSSDSGATWKTNNAPPGSWINLTSSADGSRLAAVQGGCFNPGGPGCGGPVYTSTDSGLTWTSNNIPDAFAVACSADGEKWIAAVYGGGIYVSQSTPRPSLNITRSTTNALISWIVPSAEFMLESNSVLSATNWTAVTNSPSLDLKSLNNQVNVPLQAGTHFYRLKQ